MASFGLLELVVLFISLALSLAIVVPFSGVLVRYRANFNPKGLRLDEEGNTAPPTGPVVKSYFAMFQRVYRIEVSALTPSASAGAKWRCAGMARSLQRHQ